MLKQSVVTAAALVATCMAGCSSPNEPRNNLPDYAAPFQGRLGWVVKCPLRTIENTNDMDYEIFRNPDGSPKSYEQFCEESDSSKRSR